MGYIMLQRLVVFLFLMLAVISSALAEEKEELEIGNPAPEFILKDADDKEYNSKLLLGDDEGSTKVMVLVMGDRKARKEANKWAIELNRIYGKKENVVLLMIADLRGLPFFVTEGMVKWGTKRENLPIAILLDWEGKISKMYKTQKGKVDLFAVDSDGKVAYHYAGDYSEGAVKKLRTKLQEMLKEITDIPGEDDSEEGKGA